MSRIDDVAGGFSISGLLDERAQVRGRYPIEEVLPSDLADHPANAAYSMDAAAIESRAAAIQRDGLTDLPLARRRADGSLQMISGHRRKAAYELLAKEDAAFSRMPVRIADDVDDERAVVLLHTANFFTRTLSVLERADASRALGAEVERARAENPDMVGMRTEDVKAAIIAEQTGRAVSGKTIQRQESRARKAESLVPEWRAEVAASAIPDKAIDVLAKMDAEMQKRAHEAFEKERPEARRSVTFLEKLARPEPAPADPRLARAAIQLARFAEHPRKLTDADKSALAVIARALKSIEDCA